MNDMTNHSDHRPAAARPVSSIHENWQKNEHMRHIPSIDWILWKLDVDLRHRIEILLAPLTRTAADHARRGEADAKIRTLCHALEKLTETAKPGVKGLSHPPSDLSARVGWTTNHAVTALKGLDPTTFGRRIPFHHFEKSAAEPVYAGLLSVIAHVEQLAEVVRTIDSGVDELLCVGLVTLAHPVNDQVLKPIA